MQEPVPSPSNPHHPSSLSRIVSWCFALLLGVAGGMAVDDWIRPEPSMQDYAAQVTLQQLQQQLLQEQMNADTLRGQLQVEQGAVKGLEEALHKLQLEKSRLGEQLAFYETLLPPGPQGTISVRAFDVEQMGNLLRYKVLLQRSAVNGKPFDGTMYFTAEGMRDEMPISLTLEEATAQLSNEEDEQSAVLDALTAARTQFPLSFEQFNREQGWLVLPDDFQIQTLTLSVVEGKTVRASRKVELNATEATSES